MKRTLLTAALLFALAAPALADLAIGAGLSMGTAGTREAAAVVMYDLAYIAPWQFGPVTVPDSSVTAVASTRDFEHAFIGIGLRREHILLNAGYNSETDKLEARITLLGVSF